MKYLPYLLFFLFLGFSSCCDLADTNGCTDARALNYDAGATNNDNSCNYSKATFYARFNIYSGVPIVKIDVSVDGAFTGSIFNGAIWPAGPGNCSAAGTVGYQFNSSDSVDWNAEIYLANGVVLLASGSTSPNSFSECIQINVTN